ncbi:MarR family winged helix-turn-helix transcriptional regulator [Nonomuraea sp. M3C6]|uniref:MarR family winged helix-turn-helix transcriptional regulator n=1 Tax=Nonomuraea marmarensis TaxID=3351344 RepID=A0ABW7A491_9ACTN
MNVARLRRLGRRLIELSRAAAGETKGPALTPGEEAVFEDVLRHPGSAVGEIQARTGFVQSHVSASVARMRERGLMETGPDPADGRRTQVRVTDVATRAVLRRAIRPVDEAVRQAVPEEARAERVMALLDELEALLIIEDDHGQG